MDLDEYISNVLNEMIKNQDLLKLVHFNDTYPETPLSNETIVDKSDVLFKKIFPYPFSIGIDNETMVYIFVLFDDLSCTDNSFENGELIFNVLCHKDLWHIKGGLRPFKIKKELDKTFCKTKSIGGIGKLQLKGAKMIWDNNNYSGYRIRYKIIDFQTNVIKNI